MDDLASKLAAVLNDPEQLASLQKLAAGLQADDPGTADAVDDGKLQTAMALLSRYKTAGDDNRTRLLQALRPMLSEPRQAKLDTAVKILRVLELLPYLRQSGLLDL